ncbi:DUF4249 domain-containing protein [Flavitalea flava]
MQLPESLRIFANKNRSGNRLARPAGFGCLCLVLFIFSCKKNLYPEQNLNNELVILAEITAGDSMKIPVSKSILVGSGGIISFEEVNSASVQVSRSDGRSWALKLNTSVGFSGNPASVYTSPQKPHYNTTYHLQVQDPLSGTVTAETTIPGPVRISGFDTTGRIRSGIPVLNCRFTLKDSPGVEHSYVFEAVKQIVRVCHYFFWQGTRYDYEKASGKKLYEQVKNSPGVKLLPDTIPTNVFKRLAIYTDDSNVDNTQSTSLDSPFRRIFLPGRFVSGQAYTTSVSIDRKYFTAESGQDPGRVLVQIKSVSPELYNYLFWYEKYKSDIGSVPPGQLYSPPGNIQNGLGIFGGSSKRQWVFYFDTLQ